MSFETEDKDTLKKHLNEEDLVKEISKLMIKSKNRKKLISK